jgi:hypothetical protein
MLRAAAAGSKRRQPPRNDYQTKAKLMHVLTVIAAAAVLLLSTLTVQQLQVEDSAYTAYLTCSWLHPVHGWWYACLYIIANLIPQTVQVNTPRLCIQLNQMSVLSVACSNSCSLTVWRFQTCAYCWCRLVDWPSVGALGTVRIEAGTILTPWIKVILNLNVEISRRWRLIHDPLDWPLAKLVGSSCVTYTRPTGLDKSTKAPYLTTCMQSVVLSSLVSGWPAGCTTLADHAGRTDK